MRALIIAAGAACAVLASTTAVQAADLNDMNDVSRRVSFQNVNFNDARAVDGFYSRLVSSAREVCASNAPYNSRAAGRDRACVSQIVDQSVRQLQRPLLTARHDADSGVRLATGF